MARLLVTGGAGFIGSNFVRYWVNTHEGDRVVVLDALTYAGNITSLKECQTSAQFRFVHGDIRDTALVEMLLRDERLDTVVHFAAESHVDRSISGPDAFISTNIEGTHSLLKAARTVWLEDKIVPRHRFHHVSTDEVYGTLAPDESPFTERNQYLPNSPYAASKAAADHLVRAYNRTYGLHTSISNCSNNYGPYHFPEKLIPLAILNILHGRPVPVYGDGMNVRDWLHVSDHCVALDLILERGRSGEVYNVGGGSETENIRLVSQLCSLADDALRSDRRRRQFPDAPAVAGKKSASLIKYVSDRPGHDRRYSIDCSKLMSELGYQPQVPLDVGLKDTLEWYLDNDWWWRDLVNDPKPRASSTR